MVGTDGLVRTSRRSEATEVAIANAAELWAKATTNVDTRRSKDCQRIKKKAVEDFFRSIGLDPTEVTPIEVDAWRAGLERRGLKPATVYARVSYLSSFFSWLRTHVGPLGTIAVNPCWAARSRAPRAFQTKAVRALDDKELAKLTDVVRLQAATGGPAERRDYALWLLLVTTGMRRAEALELDGSDLAFQEEGIVVTAKVKGGNYVARLVASVEFRLALIDYLSSCGRTSVLKRGGPLWVRHDNAAAKTTGASQALTAWAFAARMKELASEAGIPDFHLHQTRHTFARIVAESSGSLLETQDALGHRNPATTRAYVTRIAVKRDKFGSEVTKRLSK